MSSSVAAKPSTAPPAAPPGRAERSLVSRVLGRPEIGALAAAIVIFAFFYAVAPAFRTLPALATVPVTSLVTPRLMPCRMKNVDSVIRKLGIPVRITR